MYKSDLTKDSRRIDIPRRDDCQRRTWAGVKMSSTPETPDRALVTQIWEGVVSGENIDLLAVTELTDYAIAQSRERAGHAGRPTNVEVVRGCQGCRCCTLAPQGRGRVCQMLRTSGAEVEQPKGRSLAPRSAFGSGENEMEILRGIMRF
ncbi:hypothetical protein J6590_000198 [Homalodisca vitripennis]|nr:hypothetical protein J6590_000198 [Homalodisca vitripennis]